MRNIGTVFVFIPGILLLSAAITPTAKADAIYTYTGNDFNSFFGTELTGSNFVTASFTFANALPGELDFADEKWVSTELDSHRPDQHALQVRRQLPGAQSVDECVRRYYQ